MKNKVTLYIATHNITGKKYFGKTERFFTEIDLQENYHGSGTYWKNHIKQHGDDVTMEIYGIYNIDKVTEIAINFSKENNIVESKDWANLIEENGLGGGNLGELNGMFGNTHTDEVKSILKAYHTDTVNVRNKTTNKCYKVSRDEWKSNKNLEAESKGRKIKDTSRFGSPGELNGMFGVKHSEETKEKMRKPKGPQKKLECPYCGLIGGSGNLRRYHFENCKKKEYTNETKN